MPQPSLLSRVTIFASLDETTLRRLAELCRTRVFKRGEVIFHERDPGNALYLIESGQVKIVLVSDEGEETILHVQGPEECLGELALIDAAPRSATAVALERVQALALYRDDFLALLEQHPPVALAVMGGLAGMVRRLSSQVQDLMLLDARGRVAKKLLDLAEQHGRVTPEGIRIDLRLTQQELAQMVGLTRVSVNQHLAWFHERGILATGREGITLLKPDELRERVY
jgi:CRP/FNR family transcriptional regulator/CRP/FNR family cyclic AMP-dependent transcriptional regulator